MCVYVCVGVFFFFFPLHTTASGLGVRRRQETAITAGGHECTLRLILLLRFELRWQDIGSIIHLTMRRIKQGKEKKQNKIEKKNNKAVRCFREKLRGVAQLDVVESYSSQCLFYF